MRICKICKNEYDDGGNAWKKVCYDCYKNYRYLELFGRIHAIGYKENVYLSHPSVTKEEVDEWIRKTGKEVGWGAVGGVGGAVGGIQVAMEATGRN